MRSAHKAHGRFGGGQNNSVKEQTLTEANAGQNSVETVPDQTTTDMLYILEEEKLAGDLYEAFFEIYGAKIFDNIAASEDQHFNAVLSQANATDADMDSFVFEPAGSYVNPEIQELYDDLLAYGSTSLEAALNVGVAIETKDIIDLQEAADAAAGTPLEGVYENLLAGSYNHLDAFEGMLA